MNLDRLEYIKNVTHPEGEWAYPEYRKGSYFKQRKGVEENAQSLRKGTLVILSQNFQGNRYLSHIVEIVNEASEDRSQWENSDWGIVRWVKVVWAAEPSKAPLDAEVLKVNWGYQGTMAKSLQGPNLTEEWETLDALRAHLRAVLSEAERPEAALV